MTARWWGARLPVVAAAVALAAGCSSGGAPAPAPSDPPTSAPPTGEDTPELPEVAESPQPGPLEVYLGYAGTVRTPQDVVADVARRENATAVCMAELGFEYVPQVPALDDLVVLDGPVPGTREFIESWGYGVWSQPPGGSGGGFSFEFSSVDPNWAMREEMSEAGREAYDTALSGPVTRTGPDGSVTREGGCSDASNAPAGEEAAYLAGVRDEANAFLAALDDDSRFAEVNAAWASCMADAGLGYPRPAAAQQQFWDEVTEETADGVLDPQVAARRAPEEVRVASADYACRLETGWTERHRQIEVQLQQEYVDAHRADLDALAAALEQPVLDD